uniref:Preprotachykinin B n=1 Tax=Panulirus interruptus TaxID=6735 RepID=Q767J4_PANIN|nr:preprotachykinin B [Panulirus interruptus]
MARPGAWSVLVVLALAACVSQAQEASDRERRAPSGFLGMRGKKDAAAPLNEVDEASANDYPILPDPIAARLYAFRNGNAPVGLAVPLRGKKAPSGFLGMRGKKSDEEIFGDASDDSDLETLLKRAPSGFLGMRGKKAPSGFLGMRGKKAPSGFLGMRGKKYYDDDGEMDALIQAFTAMMDGQQQKRAPSGFLGMRGKKAIYGDDSDEELNMAGVDKRAPSGFLGMRG